MGSRSALFSIVLVCACGNLSNEDVAFLEAIPQKDALKVQVPGNGAAQAACSLGEATVYQSAKATGDSINQGVSSLLTLVDTIRAVPATTRDTDTRIWGPFPDGSHPGFEVEVRMVRQIDQTGTPWRWDYSISERKKGADFVTVLEGNFFGAQARNGTGRMTLHFESSAKLGTGNPTDPAFPMHVFYDLGDNPRTISMDLTAGIGFGLPGFDYSYEGFADGHGQFSFAASGVNGCTSEITTLFNAQGAGRDSFHVRCGPFVSAEVQQCWDVSACLTYIDDPLGSTAICNARACVLGSPNQCPAL
jgi:hypothetical protein